MKLAINNYCNSKCPYCFAGNMGIDSNTNITRENFIKALEWTVNHDDKEFILLGGEPTLHPLFGEFLEIVSKYQYIYDIKFSVLTNGVKLHEYLHLLPKDSGILINVVPENELGIFGITGLRKSLDKLKDMGAFNKEVFNVALGCNLHSEIKDYEYFWKINDEYKNTTIRSSVVSPQKSKYIEDRDSYFKLMKPVFMEFVDNVIARGCTLLLDCSEIPLCYFTNLEVAKLARLIGKDISVCGKCGTTCQFLPDLSFSCCFGDSSYSKMKDFLFNYNSPYEIMEKINKERDERILDNYIEKCKNCEFKIKGWCNAGCLGFKDGVKNEDCD